MLTRGLLEARSMQKQEKSPAELLEEKAIIQLIIFVAGNEEFGVPIDAVREIIKIGMVTPIPNSPDFIKGIVNVRGEIVTAIDVKSRFCLASVNDVEPKHIVVTKQEDGLFGLIVDEVIEVLRLQKNEIKPPPSLVTQIHKKYVNGVVAHDSRLIIILDLTSILSQKELIQYSAAKKRVYKDKIMLEENTDTKVDVVTSDVNIINANAATKKAKRSTRQPRQNKS
jgi:purine-binding chemotaxis protein CheW